MKIAHRQLNMFMAVTEKETKETLPLSLSRTDQLNVAVQINDIFFLDAILFLLRLYYFI